MIFTIVLSNMTQRLASERLEAGENRLDKIVEMIGKCRYSVHDLSKAVSAGAGESFRMNMLF